MINVMDIGEVYTMCFLTTVNKTGVDMSSGEGNGNLLQHSCLENPMDGGAWWVTVHGVMKSRTRLSDLTFTFHFHAPEKEMATHSSVLAWLPCRRVGHDWPD